MLARGEEKRPIEREPSGAAYRIWNFWVTPAHMYALVVGCVSKDGSSGTGDTSGLPGTDTHEAADTADTSTPGPTEDVPLWPSCMLTNPLDVGTDGYDAGFAWQMAAFGIPMPALGLLEALNRAEYGGCTGYADTGDVWSFDGDCSTTDGATLSGHATYDHGGAPADARISATAFTFVDADGSGWAGEGEWTQTHDGPDVVWTAMGYDYSTASGDNENEFRGGFDRDDEGWCEEGHCESGGYVEVFSLMDRVSGQFCYAAVMSDDGTTGPGVVRIEGLQRVEIVFLTADSGTIQVDDGPATSF